MAADKAVVIELLGDGGDPIEYTVADANNISQGDLLFSVDPRTASANSSAYQNFAGIAARDKVANDGITVLPLWTNGIFDLKISGQAVTAGQLVVGSGNNLITRAQDAANNAVASGSIAAASAGIIIGRALDTAAAGTAETIPVLVRV